MKPLAGNNKLKRTLLSILRPIMYITGFFSFLALLYAACIYFHVPQRMLQSAFVSIAPDAKVGPVTGTLPFCISDIELPGKAHIHKLDVGWNWATLQWDVQAQALEIDFQNTESTESQDPAEWVRNFLTHAKKIKHIRWLHSVRIERILTPQRKTPMRLVSRCDRFGAISIKLEVPDRHQNFFITLDSLTVQDQYVHGKFFYIQQKDNKLTVSVDATLHMTPEICTILGTTESGQYSFLSQGEIDLKLRHCHLQEFLQNKKHPDVVRPAAPLLQTRLHTTIAGHRLHMNATVATDYTTVLDIYEYLKPAKSLNVIPMAKKKKSNTLTHNVQKLSPQGVERSLGFVKIQRVGDKAQFSGEYHPDPIPIAYQKIVLTSQPVKKADPLSFSVTGEISKTACTVQTLTGTTPCGEIKIQAPIHYDTQARKISPIQLQLGERWLNVSPIQFTKSCPQDNHFTVSPCSISYTNNEGTLHCGTASLDGKIGWEAENTQLLCHLRLDHQPCKKLHKPRCLDVTAEADIALSLKECRIQKLKIASDMGRYMTQGNLKISPSTPNFIQVFRQTSPNYDDPLHWKHNLLLEGSLKGDIALFPFSAFLKNGDFMRGVLNTNIKIGGSLGRILLSGTADLRDGTYENIANGVVLKNIRFHAIGKEDALEIQEIRLIDGSRYSRALKGQNFSLTNPPRGTATGHGSFRLTSPDKSLVPYLDLSLQCHYLQVAYSDLVRARVSGNLFLKGPVHGVQEKPTITGDVVVDAMVVDINYAAVASTTDRSVNLVNIEQIPVVPVSTSSVERFTLNVGMTAGKEVLVRGDNSLTCYMQGKVYAKGPLEDPYLVGKLSVAPVPANTYNLFGKIMVVTDGTIEYMETPRNDPKLWVQLQTRMGDKDVWAVVSGFTTAMRITLRSNPPMASEEILALLLFRQGLNELSTNQNLHVKAFSSQMLQNNPLSFFDKIRNSVGLDSLEVVETQDISSGETIQTLRVGKQLKKVRVFVDKNISTKNDSKMTVRYDLTPQLGIEANVSTDEKSNGLGIQWLKRY